MQLTLKSCMLSPGDVAMQVSLYCQLRCCYTYPLPHLPGRLLDP